MALARTISPETLDQLTESDPRAIRSRKDLRRINYVMGTRGIILKMLIQTEQAKPLRMIELGAGDGTLMLSIARKLAGQWPKIHLTLLDRQSLLSPQTINGFHQLGWQLDFMQADVLDWATRPAIESWDIALCNLFLHHFHEPQLHLLLQAISQRAKTFVACEPRRGWLPLIASHLVGAVGANAVTREDAVLSVYAGFRNAELSGLWSQAPGVWQLAEYTAGLFSHCFVAKRSQGSA